MAVKEQEGTLTGAGFSRVIGNNFPLPFQIEEIVVGSKFLGTNEIRIDIDRSSVHEGHNQSLVTGVEELQCAAAPVFGLLDLRQDKSRLQGVQEFVWNQRIESGAGPANQHVPKIQAGFPLGVKPGENTRSGVRVVLHGNAVFA